MNTETRRTQSSIRSNYLCLCALCVLRVQFLFKGALIWRVIFWIIAIFSFQACSDQHKKAGNKPQVLDPNLKLELISKHPDIVTPIGLAIDNKDAIYVLESHTHSPPSDYPGPKYDFIKKGIDRNNDGKPESWTIFADSIVNGANLAISEEGEVYITAKNIVLAFKDLDGDGKSDQRRTLVEMTLPEYVYDHAGILGIAIGRDGWLYLSRGNLGSKAWRIEGRDGSVIKGYGEGGVIFRCKTDGSNLEKLATGFWNPFGLKFTLDGRLFATDNDPDSRGPNRLVELVPGGDYGFKCLYGGNGLHPYVAWNGELPGTLPFAAALGEAPCALLDGGYTNFGEDYAGSVLVNVWEEKNIVRIPLHKRESSVEGQAEVIVQGDTSFHPVAFATDSKGNLYISDWVKREYPNHSQGRIWRLSSDNPEALVKKVEGKNTINRFAENKQSADHLMETLRTGDVYQKAMARYEMRTPVYYSQFSEMLNSSDPALRLQALLIALKNDFRMDKQTLVQFLKDEDADIRRTSLIYTGTKMRTDLQPALKEVLAAGKIGPELFNTWLATIEHLQPEFIKNFTNRSGISADKIEKKLPEFFIESMISDTSIPEATRALAIPYLSGPDKKQDLLLALLNNAENELFKSSLIKALKMANEEKVNEQLIRIALNDEEDITVRAQAILSLSTGQVYYCAVIKRLLSEENPQIRQTAARYLCKCRGDQGLKAEVEKIVTNTSGTKVKEIWDLCTGKIVDRPSNQEQWVRTVNEKGNSQVGRLVFESERAQCQSCHQINGWGGTYGPNLSKIGSSKSRTQLINAILDPSLEIAPEWQGWFITGHEGATHYGRQIDVHLNRAELMNLTGSFDTYRNPKAYGVMDQSLMPAGLENTLTQEEFNDLIAYLESLK